MKARRQGRYFEADMRSNEWLSPARSIKAKILSTLTDNSKGCSMTHLANAFREPVRSIASHLFELRDLGKVSFDKDAQRWVVTP